MRKLFATLCVRCSIAGIFLITSDLFAEEAVFTGKLTRKYYQHLIPQAVELGVFGWFLELDSSSKASLQKKIAALNVEDQQHCAELGFDLSMVQLFLSGAEDRQLCRHFEGERVEVLGKWPSSPHVFRPIPSYQLHLTELKQIPRDAVKLTRISHKFWVKISAPLVEIGSQSSEDSVELTRPHSIVRQDRQAERRFSPRICEKCGLSGVLHFRVFPGPPNYDCVEAGDYPEGCWVLKLDDQSKDMLTWSMSLECDEKPDEIAIEMDNQFEGVLEQYANAQVTCLGNVHHAETAHHHTPLLLRSCRIARNKSL